jgi:chromosome segregation ATPase
MSVPHATATIAQRTSQASGEEAITAFMQMIQKIEGVVASQAQVIKELQEQNVSLKASLEKTQTVHAAKETALQAQVLLLSTTMKRVEEESRTTTTSLQNLQQQLTHTEAKLHSHVHPLFANTGGPILTNPNIGGWNTNTCILSIGAPSNI